MQTFKRRFLVLVAAGATGCCGIFGLTAVAKYKPYGVPDLLIDQWEIKQASLRALGSSDEAGRADAKPLRVPVAVTEETEHDFGMLDAGSSAQHTFVIRNEGEAPLVISAADTSCKCTVSKSSKDLLSPGESAEVTLTWNTGSSRRFYRQYAIVRTNDPERPEIELAVEGQIQTQLGFDAEEIVAPAVSPGQGAEASAIVFSQTLDDFEIVDVQSGLPGMQFRYEPVAEETRTSLSAKSAWRLFVSTDASLETGAVVDTVRVSIRSEQLEAAEQLLVREIPFRGRVLSPITFYGSQLHSEEGLNLGVVNAGTKKVSHVLVRARGHRLPKQMVVSDVEPAFLQTEISPIESRPGVFKLTITVPADAPQTYFNLQQKQGYVAVQDPENPTMRNWFPVRGAVVGL